MTIRRREAGGKAADPLAILAAFLCVLRDQNLCRQVREVFAKAAENDAGGHSIPRISIVGQFQCLASALLADCLFNSANAARARAASSFLPARA